MKAAGSATERIGYSVVMFCLLMAITHVYKPPVAFDAAGRPRPFTAYDEGGTVFPLGVLTAVCAVGSFATFATLDSMGV